MYLGTLVTGQRHVRVVLLQLRYVVVEPDQQALAYVHVVQVLRIISIIIRSRSRRRAFIAVVLVLIIPVSRYQFALATGRLQLVTHLSGIGQVPLVEKIDKTKGLEGEK